MYVCLYHHELLFSGIIIFARNQGTSSNVWARPSLHEKYQVDWSCLLCFDLLWILNLLCLFKVEDQTSILFKSYCQQSQLQSYFSNQVPASVDDSTYFTLASKQICPTYVLASSAYYSRCLPTIITSIVDGVTNALTANDTSSNVSYSITDLAGNGITDQTVSQAAKYVINLLNIQSIGSFKFIYLTSLLSLKFKFTLSQIFSSVCNAGFH